MNITLSRVHQGLGWILLAALSGCAMAYDRYPCGCVHYDYCPDRPLPFQRFGGCPCDMVTRSANEPNSDWKPSNPTD